MAPVARIALVGNRSADVQAHARIPGLLTALLQHDDIALDAYWMESERIAPGTVAGFDGVWVTPGSPYRSEAGVLAAIGDARERGIPFLGSCGGFQHALLEFARTVCGLADASHVENDPGGSTQLFVELACSLAGHEVAVELTPGTLAERILETDRTIERYLCHYGPAAPYLETLREHGLVFSGRDADGEVRIAEIEDHPFFLGTLFQPELSDRHPRVHPVIRAFAAAAAKHAEARETLATAA